MRTSAFHAADGEDASLEVLWEDPDRAFCRLLRADDESATHAYMPVVNPDAEQATRESINRLAHEYELRNYLDSNWSLRPLELVRGRGETLLVVEYKGGEPLDRLIGQPMEIGLFLRLAVALAGALGQLHAQGLIHKDVKPANVIVKTLTGDVWLTGFGIASRSPRERQIPEPPEYIAGTIAYMAPEQTGRVNRSIDSRSDLYSLGVTLYEMLTGSLPFAASDPMEWVHCHIARQPVSPVERRGDIPPTVSAIIMKLLSKAAEERYQTALGVENDLRRCQAEWNTPGGIQEFRLGDNDTSDRLTIPEKLYGRERELQTLLTSFDRIVAGGRPELVLVSGYSGIGKSAIVNELHKPLVPPSGLFATGKFDQFKRDIPYATLAQAFLSLIRPLLAQSEEDLHRWRADFHEALGDNGQLIIELVPELRLIVGEQPSVPELPPQEAQKRFQYVLRRFISVFARPEHPLALFLDDLQWLDPATLDFLEDLLVCNDLRHLLLIGAYRDNEVDANHSLFRRLNAIREAGVTVQDIVLTPLGRDDLCHLLMDSLQCEAVRAMPLAKLIHDKTTGNPFFAIQYISALAEETLLDFSYVEKRWTWDLPRIRAKGVAENVVELMVAKLSRLPLQTQTSLQLFACIGNRAEFEMLAMVHEESVSEVHAHLWEAVRSGLIFRAKDTYRFLHDRVQEAAYSQIPEERRGEVHLQIGMLLAAQTESSRRDEVIFEIVNQLNRGAHLISTLEQREQVAELNLIAARRAKASTAYESAIRYLAAGSALLTQDVWDRNYELAFSTEYLMAECELLTADLVAAENRLFMLAERVKCRHDSCVVTRLQLTLYTTLDQCERGVDVFLEWLRRDGTSWSNHPCRDDVMQEYERIWTLLGNRQIEDLLQLPLITDQVVLDTMDVFTEVVTLALHFDEHLASLVVCRLVTLSLEHGNCDGSCFAYVWIAMFAGPRFSNYKDGFRFGKLGYDLVEKRGLTRYQARTYMSFGALVIPWAKHVASGREMIRRAIDAAHQVGDLTFVCYSRVQLITIRIAAGDPLEDVQSEAEESLAFAKLSRFGLVIQYCGAQLGLIRTLRGLTSIFGRIDHDGYSELEVEEVLAGNPNLAMASFFYWTRKLQALYFSGDYGAAIDASHQAKQLLWTSGPMFETAEYHFYSALARSGAWALASNEDRAKHLGALLSHRNQIEVWALNSPETFDNRAAILNAEIARIEGRILDAETLYEDAIRLASINGFVHNEAIYNELAGRFYAARGFVKIASAYLLDARHCYMRWGADGKVRQLEQLYPQLSSERPLSEQTSTILKPVEHLDLATVIRISEAVSGEIVFEKLIDTLLRAAVEHAGAERGLLILPQGNEYCIEAEVTVDADRVNVELRRKDVTADKLPASMLRYVARTKEIVVLQDASLPNTFSSDEYISGNYARSVLCLPILKQTRLLGILYLENKLTAHVFNPSRMATLKLLASGASMSIENARLYLDLAEREARIRRLVDANIIGIAIFDFEGQILDANDAYLQIVGYEREHLLSGSLRWRDLTPPEWLEREERDFIPELRLKGRLAPYEKEYIRKDGNRVPVLLGLATFEDGGNQGVAFVLDLTERTNASIAHRTLQMELAHANRLATMGQLAASIAHEVNQPIGAARNNAHAALRFLTKVPPDLAEANEALECVVSDTYRAGEIIHGIRDQIKKVPPTETDITLNDAIQEVIALVQGELLKSRTTLQTAFAQGLPVVHGDRVQLQQVMLNLILNGIEAMAGTDDEDRTLTIRTELSPSEGLLVAVGDSGPGIAPEDKERIFESFHTTKEAGVGIGLSICRTIIAAHGGRLWADHNQPRGAILRFTLPVHF